ncbi:MAG: L,D-transpeptidase [Anaerolineae bacterium]|nr:L,D-transpeptidase [Anaerolineae bacterium]
MKRAIVTSLVMFFILAGPFPVRPAAAAICSTHSSRSACESRFLNTPVEAPFTPPTPRPNSLTEGVIYGWIEDYAYFYDRPAPGARHVRTATTGFFYGPAERSYTDENGNTWYYVWDNWLPARYYHIIEASTFAGVEVNAQPVRPFGWILRAVQPVPSPGAGPQPGVRELQRYDFVQIYAAAGGPAGDLWYRVGAQGWVRYDALALTTVRERPSAVGPDEYWVDVDLSEQTITAYEGDRLVYAALIASGLSRWATREGLNQVWERRLSAPMSGGDPGNDYYYIDGVLHTLYFDGEISLHNAFWHDDFGRQKSHGCVNLAPRVAEWIYYWSASGPNDLWVWSHYSMQADFVG